MPTLAERAGDLSSARQTVLDPATGLPFANNVIPASRISPQASALLNLYPIPNFSGSSRYNFQIPIISGLHQDDLQSRVSKQKRKNFFAGNFSLQSTRTDDPNLFGFLDTGRVLGVNSGVNYRRTFSPRTFVNLGLQFSRLNTRVTPHFANRRNISGEAGVQGNNQEASNWGPPALVFSTGIAALGDAQWSQLRNQTSALSADLGVLVAGEREVRSAGQSRDCSGFFGRGSGDRRPVTIQRFAAPGPEQLRAAPGFCMATDGRVFHGDSRRVRSLLRHFGISADRDADGAAGAAIQKPACVSEPCQSTDARRWLQSVGSRESHDIRRRSSLSSWLFPELAAFRPARSSRRIADDGHLLGGKGTRAQQQFLPNTFPAGAANPCPACPSGFTYLVSNGNSTREAARFNAPQASKRLHRSASVCLFEIHR